MKANEYTVWRGRSEGVFLHEGQEVKPPQGWTFVSSGDAALTRRLKAAGEYWLLVHKRKNRIEALGLWTGADVEAVRAMIEAERSTPTYRKKLEADRRRRELAQADYEVEFRAAVLKFLDFNSEHAVFAEKLSDAVTVHAVPVGSGTVARTSRIPIERRAEAAVIAWMRHQTTAYDHMHIARIKGERREVRRKLAERSRMLLSKYRSGDKVDFSACPLAAALK
ncbi:MAG: DUF2293 domain-containing protein [Victivallales bacterium]|nr:DUF2293 domain-containing protein [Victivallales bacterium]